MRDWLLKEGTPVSCDTMKLLFLKWWNSLRQEMLRVPWMRCWKSSKHSASAASIPPSFQSSKAFRLGWKVPSHPEMWREIQKRQSGCANTKWRPWGKKMGSHFVNVWKIVSEYSEHEKIFKDNITINLREMYNFNDFYGSDKNCFWLVKIIWGRQIA